MKQKKYLYFCVVLFFLSWSDAGADAEDLGSSGVPGSADTGSLTAGAMGVPMRIGPGRTPLRREPRQNAEPVGELVGFQSVLAVPAVPSGEVYRDPEWALIDLAGTRGDRGSLRFAWVPMSALRAESGYAFDPGRTPPEFFLNHHHSRVLLHREPFPGEAAAPVFYVDLETGAEQYVTRRRRESRIVTLLQASEILVTSAGTGPGNPEIIELTDARSGQLLFGGYTWSLHDAIRENRYVRVIPAPPDLTWKETPGLVLEPALHALAGPPWFFTEEQLAEYEAFRARVREDSAFTAWVVPQVWVDTRTGETAPREYSFERRFEQ